jgi:preprotein translocase subunit SecE
MANKGKKSMTTKAATPAAEVSSITRITATDTKSAKLNATKKPKAPQAPRKKKEAKGPVKVLRSIGGYFKGAWFELRQVRWPNRRATWSLTAAVLIFTSFFVLLVVLLDILFKYLFGLILG